MKIILNNKDKGEIIGRAFASFPKDLREFRQCIHQEAKTYIERNIKKIK
jgi:hypothetical protein